MSKAYVTYLKKGEPEYNFKDCDEIRISYDNGDHSIWRVDDPRAGPPGNLPEKLPDYPHHTCSGPA